MLQYCTRANLLTLLLGVFFSLAAIGCGSDTPVTPQMSEQERQEKIRQDAEQMMKERQQGKPRPQ
jgi:hypothetical protein